MVVTARLLNRATLERQGLLRREPSKVVDAVSRVLALQAQEPASPYIALWNRVAGCDPVELDAAFADASIVKATLSALPHCWSKLPSAETRVVAGRAVEPRAAEFTIARETAE